MIDAPEPAVVYAVADTHLGLRASGPSGHHDEPVLVADFFRWLSELPAGGYGLSVLKGGELANKQLLPATHLVLLGDILELWDSENQAVLLSSFPVQEVLGKVQAEKIYVLGNHDNILESLVGSYPFGFPAMRIARGTFPELDEQTGIAKPLRIGNQSFLYVHGHQFDLHFMRAGGTWRLLGHLRQFGAALGGYAWMFAILWAGSLIVQLFVSPEPWGWLLVVTLPLLWIPRFYMTVGRKIWRRIAGTRYDRAGTLRGFRSWWNGFHKKVKGADDVGIVYGHTHYLDWIAPGITSSDTAATKPLKNLNAFLDRLGTSHPRLFNLSSWVSTQGPYKSVVNATIFYADEGGPLFLGWDWRERRPFHIPFEYILKRRSMTRLSPEDRAVAEGLRWPKKLIDKWALTDEDV